MKMSGFADAILGSIVVLGIAGCAGGKQPTGIPSDLDQLELAEHGIAPFPQDRVRFEVQQQVDDLRQSGPDAGKFQRYGAILTEEWHAISERLGEDVEFSGWECFAAGCTVVSRHAAAGALTQTLAEFAHANAFSEWDAGKFQGAPLRSDDGRIEVAWIFFAPLGGPDEGSGFEPAPFEPSDAQEELR